MNNKWARVLVLAGLILAGSIALSGYGKDAHANSFGFGLSSPYGYFSFYGDGYPYGSYNYGYPYGSYNYGYPYGYYGYYAYPPYYAYKYRYPRRHFYGPAYPYRHPRRWHRW